MAYFTTSDNTKIFYEVDGAGEKTILIAPGGGCTTKYFDPIVPKLAEKCRVVRYDFRGHGGSERCDGTMDADRMVDDIKELIDYLKIDHLYLGGWSLGAMMILLYIDKYGEDNIDGLVYIDMTPTNMGFDEEEKQYTGGGKTGPDLFIRQLYGMNKPDPDGLGRLNGFFGIHPEEHMDMLPILKTEGARVAPAYRIAANVAGANQDTREIMKKMNVPMLHMYGTAFKVFPKAAADFIGKNVKNIKQVPFEGCGHALFMENPDKVDKEIITFMNL